MATDLTVETRSCKKQRRSKARFRSDRRYSQRRMKNKPKGYNLLECSSEVNVKGKIYMHFGTASDISMPPLFWLFVHLSSNQS